MRVSFEFNTTVNGSDERHFGRIVAAFADTPSGNLSLVTEAISIAGDDVAWPRPPAACRSPYYEEFYMTTSRASPSKDSRGGWND
jgi:hypothetical protein